jgi:LytS/YehU family sensor histidine kinase
MNIVQVIGIAGGISLVFTFGWTLLNSMGDGVIVECCGYQSKSLTFPSYLRAVATNYPYLFVWSVLYFGIRFLQEWECERQRAEEAIAAAQQTQLQTLRYHLNPHFLFNALNSIRALVDENSKEARTLVTALSEFLRYSLVSRNQKVVSLKEEMDAIRNYLQVEKRRYEDKLEVTYDIDARTENLPILSFLIQPLVENAVKYGMQTSPMPLRITFRSLVENGNLKFLIINTGTWFTQDQNNIEPMTFPSGLMNVKKRLEASYPNAHNLSHYELDGCVCISLEISTIQSESDEEKDKSVNR